MLLKAIDGHTYEIPILLAVALGTRLGEAVATRIEDWDFQSNCVYLHQQVARTEPYAKGERNKYGIVPHLKGGKKKGDKGRCLGVPQSLMDKVKDRAHEVKLERLKSTDYKDLGLLCCKEDGDFLLPTTVYRAYKKILQRNGLKENRFHDLRGSNLTLLDEHDVPISKISKNAGHADEAITRDRYIKSTQVDMTCANVVQSVLFDGLAAH